MKTRITLTRNGFASVRSSRKRYDLFVNADEVLNDLGIDNSFTLSTRPLRGSTRFFLDGGNTYVSYGHADIGYATICASVLRRWFGRVPRALYVRKES